MKEEIRIVVPKEEAITEEGYLIIANVSVKLDNETWRFHKSDPDPFPSVPHGDNVNTGEKLNVYTGEVFGTNRKIVRRLRKRQPMLIRRELRHKGVILEESLF